MEVELNPFDQILKKIYYNANDPGSFGGRERLFLQARKINSDIKRKDVEKWLKRQIVYTLHKQAQKKFKRNPVISEYPLENFQADLIDYQIHSKDNNGYSFILTVIDVFTKRAWAVPLKNKGKISVTTAMESVLEDNCPMKLMTDKGKEFENDQFKKLMEKYKITHFFAQNQEIKCSVVERFNKTLKNRLQKYFTMKGKSRWIDEIKNIISSYNNSYHRSIKMSPNNVTLENAKIVFKNIYKYPNKREYLRKHSRPKLEEGEDVRKKYGSKVLDRGYYPNWTDETFKVQKVRRGNRKPYYLIEDSRGNISKKRYYPEELQSVIIDKYRVEKILKRRKINGKKEVFVKWLNYPDSENSWIPEENLTNING